ncbi:transcription factor 20 [Erpetoichthys calabaricus]|uniref:transcription factor 20 n=1 Tax=Erpetoichthys calabaricus TaxID=27687 RepID=UPI0022340A18|nr:transcription factor 20 [Erpetoichthys calabaricus]XP_051790317.1 transcription factor 20 [Erpetoichthys calabaricus]
MQTFREQGSTSSTSSSFPPNQPGAAGGGGGSRFSHDSLNSPRLVDAGQQGPQQLQHGHHVSQAALLQGYGARRSGLSIDAGGCVPQGVTGYQPSGSSGSLYRKEMAEYYYLAGKEAQRRGHTATPQSYAAFGYPASSLEGQMGQYRHSASMAHFSPESYNTGPFSPSQYSTGQTQSTQQPQPPQQVVTASSQLQQSLRQQAAAYASHPPLQPQQTVPHTSAGAISAVPHIQTHQRGYQHRVGQYGHYTASAPSVSSSYSSPPQRYAQSGYDNAYSKINSSVSQFEAGSQQQCYSSGYGYLTQQQHLSKVYERDKHVQHTPGQIQLHQPPIQYRNAAGKVVNAPAGGSGSSTVGSGFGSQEVASKSPMQQFHQNFSPISNPSPAASVVQSPSCSSSPSPLMGTGSATGELGNTTRNSRLMQSVPQLSPTPSTNLLATSPSHSLYKASALDGLQEKRLMDPGLKSLSALSSQVANIPNTVQHMLLTDTLLSNKKKEQHYGSSPSSTSSNHSSQHHLPRKASRKPTGNVDGSGVMGGGAGSSTNSEGGSQPDDQLKSPQSLESSGEEQASVERMRQLSGQSTGSESANYSRTPKPPPVNDTRGAMGVVLSTLDSSNDAGKATQQHKTEPLSQPPSCIPPAGPTSPHLPSIPMGSTAPVTPTGETTNFPPPPPPLPSSPASTASACTAVSAASSVMSSASLTSISMSEALLPPSTGSSHFPQLPSVKDSDHADDEDEDEEKENVNISKDLQLERKTLSEEKNRQEHAEEPSIRSVSAESESRGGPINNMQPQATASAEKGSVGVIVSARSEQIENRHALQPPVQDTQPHRPPSQHSKQSSEIKDCPTSQEQQEESAGVSHSVAGTGDTASHNGEGSSDHVHLSTGSGHTPTTSYAGKVDSSASNPMISPYGFNEAIGTGAAPRNSLSGLYHVYGHSGTRKSSVEQERRSSGRGDKMQQTQYPSLLQEVLQGYHLERRYGRQLPEPSATHLHSASVPHMALGHTETMRPHVLVNQPGATAENVPSKHHYPPAGGSRSQGSLDSWVWGDKKGATSDLTPPAARKHINLAEFSHARKLSEMPSTAQQLLMQEQEGISSIPGGPAGMSERRSVICDVSPSRRTPERDRRESSSMPNTPASSAGAASLPVVSSVIQPAQPQVVQHDLTKAKESGTVSKESGTPTSLALTPDSRAHGSGPHSSVNLHHSGSPNQQVSAVDYHAKDCRPAQHLQRSRQSSHSSSQLTADTAETMHSVSPSGNRTNNTTGTTMNYPHHHSPGRYPGYYHSLEASGSSSRGYGLSGDSGHKSLNQQHHKNQMFHLPPPPGLLSTDDRQDWPPNQLHQHHHHSNASGAGLRRSGGSHKDLQVMSSGSSVQLQGGSLLGPQQGSYFEMGGIHQGKLWGGPPSSAIPNSRDTSLDFESRRGSSGQMLSTAPKRHEVTGTDGHSRGVTEEIVQSFRPSAVPGAAQGGSGGSLYSKVSGHEEGGHPNPLIMRRRVRSFISPIPAKRQHQDGTSQLHQRSAYSVGGPSDRSVESLDHPRNPVMHPQPTHTAGVAPQEQLSKEASSPDPNKRDSPASGSTTVACGINSISNSAGYSSTSPANAATSPPPVGKTKILPPRKGRGLKLEAIVQKITSPNVKKGTSANSGTGMNLAEAFSANSVTAHSSSGDSVCGGVFQDIGEARSADRSTGHNDGLSLDEIMSYRGEEETGPPPPVAVPYPGTSFHHSTENDGERDQERGRNDNRLQFSEDNTPPSASGRSDLEELRKADMRLQHQRPDLTLLTPLPPMPSSSALSDIQKFATGYPRMEENRDHALLLRHQLEAEKFGSHTSQNRADFGLQQQQHDLHSVTMKPPIVHPSHTSETKTEAAGSGSVPTVVPKGYFPSGKKKGRPVGSVNKQKRAQQQAAAAAAATTTASQPPIASQPLSTSASVPQNTLSSTGAAASPFPTASSTATTATSSPAEFSTDTTVPLSTGNDVEGIHQQCGKRQRKVGISTTGGVVVRRRRRRGGKAGMDTDRTIEDPNYKAYLGQDRAGQLNENLQTERQEHKKPIFSPYIHVEKKVELGAFCTIINAEDEEQKKVVVATLASELQTQLLGKHKEQPSEVKEKSRHTRTSSPQPISASKALPASSHLVLGPVMTESSVIGRLLCCLCGKWANYKNLGDLYGPYYPPEYAARLPKNPPQVKQQLQKGTAGQTEEVEGSELSPGKVKVRHKECGIEGSQQPEAEGDKLGVEEKDTLAPTMSSGRELRKLTAHPRYKRRHRSSEEPSASKPSQPQTETSSIDPEPLPIPEMPLDSNELWVHENCIAWTSGVFLVCGKLYGLQEALEGARETRCSHCQDPGSTLGCYSKGCSLRYHYMCALEAECSLNEDNFSLRCPKHKFPQQGKTGKVTPAEQSERG